MGSPFVSTDTYTRTIGDSPDAHGYVAGVTPFEVELRPLDAGDRAKIRDALALERPDGSTGLALGELELLHVTKALVSWSVGATLSAANVRRLQPAVLEAIRGLVEWGEEKPHPTHAELEEAKRKTAPVAERELQERELAELEQDELRDGEEAGSVPLESSAGAAGDGS